MAVSATASECLNDWQITYLGHWVTKRRVGDAGGKKGKITDLGGPKNGATINIFLL
jgi:hypothetical protein